MENKTIERHKIENKRIKSMRKYLSTIKPARSYYLGYKYKELKTLNTRKTI